MKNIIKYAFGAVALSIGLTLGSCSDFEPTGYEALPELPVVSNLKAEVEGHNINVTWQLPSSEGKNSSIPSACKTEATAKGKPTRTTPDMVFL